MGVVIKIIATVVLVLVAKLRGVKRLGMEAIEKAYYSGGAGALASQKVFLREHPQFDKRQVEQFFRDNEVVRQFYGRRKSIKKYGTRMVAYYPFQRVHVDLADFRNTRTRFHYCLIAICNYSKFLMVMALKKKSSEVVASALLEIYEKICNLRAMANLTTLFITDAGREFNNSLIRKTFKRRRNVFFHIARSSTSKAFLAERMIGTLRRRLPLLALHDNTRKPWFEHLTSALYSYNQTKQAGLGDCTPIQAAPLHPRFVQRVIAQRSELSLDKVLEQMAQGISKAGLQKGDYVRTVLQARLFAKGSKVPKIGTKLYIVYHIKLPNINKPLSYPYYRIRDLEGRKVRRLYQRHELVKVDPASRHHPGHQQYRQISSSK